MNNTPNNRHISGILRKLRLTISIAFVVITFFHVNTQKSMAADVQIDVGVTFLESLSLVVEEMEFGVFSFNDGAGANDITISAEDGAITCSNTTDYTCPPTGNPGKVGVNGSQGYPVDISCDSNAVMSNGNEGFNVEDVKINLSGTEYNCSGVGSPVTTHSLAGDSAQDSFTLGAKLVIPATGINESGEYSTAQSGGDPISIQVLYQ